MKERLISRYQEVKQVAKCNSGDRNSFSFLAKAKAFILFLLISIIGQGCSVDTSTQFVAVIGLLSQSQSSTTANSSVAYLSNLTASAGTLSPVFSQNTSSYSFSVISSVTSTTITPTSPNTTDTITVNGTSVISGTASGAITLNVGVNTITVIVTSSSGVSGTYTITVTRAAVDTSLSALTISSGTLNPVFASATTAYTATVSNATASVTVTPTVTDPTSTIKVNTVSVASGTASGAIALAVGSNTISIVVTGTDASTTTYTITVTRQNGNADLASLTMSLGTLTPAFAAGTTSYTVSLANSVGSITVTPTASDAANATIKVNTVSVASGSASGSLAMSVGSNTITIVVTAQDLSTKTYTVTVTRLASTVYRIFATNSAYDGNLKGTAGDGPAGADAKCNADANKPNDGSTYKAMLVDSANRQACTNADCSPAGGQTNWVLKSSTAYVRASDSAALFTTSANNVFVFGAMTNTFDSGAQKLFWTGLRTQWQTSTFVSNCNDWTSNSNLQFARYGVSDSSSSSAISSNLASDACNNSRYLLCVEQ